MVRKNEKLIRVERSKRFVRTLKLVLLRLENGTKRTMQQNNGVV